MTTEQIQAINSLSNSIQKLTKQIENVETVVKKVKSFEGKIECLREVKVVKLGVKFPFHSIN